MSQMTKHAASRRRQRSIPQLIIDWLFDYGHREFDKHGAYRLYFSRESLKKLQRDVGHEIVRRLGHFRNTYLVVATSGEIITLGYRS